MSLAVDAATVAVSALISASVAGVVTVGVNVLLGGSMEVHKQRALDRHAVLRALNESIRLQLNAVKLIGTGADGWTSTGNKVTEFSDQFDTAYDEMVESYQSIRRHLASMDDIEPEHTIGRAVLCAGVYVERVHKFRIEAIGHPPDALMAHRADMGDDMRGAATLLEQARDCLRVGPLRRRKQLRRLSGRLDELDQLGRERREPKTPMTYRGALNNQRSRSKGL
jgi:hypothetical protein